MFGYIRPFVPDLRVRENEYYRAIYCGLCRSLGKCTGCASRFTLNYDFVFAALFRMAVCGEVPKLSGYRCAANPTQKQLVAEPCESLNFAARAGILLSYEKALDDTIDEKGSKRHKAKLLLTSLSGMEKNASAALPGASEALRKSLSELSEVEKQAVPSVDIPADIFGKALADLLSYGLEGDQKRLTFSAGRNLGRWLYIIDAADDLEGDIKAGRFNPFALLYGEDKLDEEKRGEVFNALTAELMKLDSTFDLIEQKDEQREIFGLLGNIIHLGMPDAAQRVLYSATGGKDKSDE